MKSTPRVPKYALDEDALIQALMDAKGRRVEIIAFSIPYAGTLQRVDVDEGIIVIEDGEDQAVLEIERVESFSLLPEPERT